MPPRREPTNGFVPMSFVREGRTINYTITQKDFDDIKRIKENAPIINKQTTEMCVDIESELKSAGIIAQVTTRPFRDLKENKGYEFLNPRNYLTNERVEVNIGGTVTVYFWGRYADLIDAKNKIINSIKNGEKEPVKEKTEIHRDSAEVSTSRPKRASSNTERDTVEHGKSGGSGETDVSNLRLQLRVRKFQGDT